MTDANPSKDPKEAVAVKRLSTTTAMIVTVAAIDVGAILGGIAAGAVGAVIGVVIGAAVGIAAVYLKERAFADANPTETPKEAVAAKRFSNTAAMLTTIAAVVAGAIIGGIAAAAAGVVIGAIVGAVISVAAIYLKERCC